MIRTCSDRCNSGVEWYLLVVTFIRQWKEFPQGLREGNCSESVRYAGIVLLLSLVP